MGRRCAGWVIVLAFLGACMPGARAIADTLSYRHGPWREISREVPQLGTRIDWLKAAPRRPAALTALPWLSGDTDYVAVPLGEGPTEFWAAFDPQANGGVGALYFDTDGDGDLAEEQPVARDPGRGGGYYGPIRAELTREGRLGPYHFHMRRNGNSRGASWQFSPACYNRGWVTIDGDPYEIAVTDGMANGRFNDLWNPAAKWVDHSYIDWNGDGVFGARESLYCTRRYQRGGRWYDVSFSADGLEVTFTRAEFPMGVVTIGDIEMAAQFTSKTGKGGFNVAGIGRIEVPADEYAILRCWVKRYGKDGVQWEACGSARPAVPVVVRAGEETPLVMGLPFKPTVLITSSPPYRRGGNIQFKVTLQGADGKEYQLQRGGMAPAPPEIVVHDKSGKQVGNHIFDRGVAGTHRGSWRVPRRLRGKITVTPVIDAGPFDTEAEDVVLDIE